MALITDIFASKKKTFSFEVYPVTTPEATAKLLVSLKELCALKPDFISCTYGAGGGNRSKTLDIVEHIQKTHGVTAMAHLTCVLQGISDIQNILDEFKKRGIHNILALRGDPPKDQAPESAPLGDFRYSSDLVRYIRSKLKEAVAIGVAGFPEGHLLAQSKDADAKFLNEKILAGADFVITQLFFDNKLYFDYVERLKRIGVTKPVIPGILPITDYGALKRFCERCGASIPKEIHEIFEPISNNPEAMVQAGIDFAVTQCRELLKGGAPGIHFYALNKAYSVSRILPQIRSI